jgi:hypothetical protein
MATWSETGTKLTTLDDVGVGTNDPQSKLHSNGTLTVTPGGGPDSRIALGSGRDAYSQIRSTVVQHSTSDGHRSLALSNGSTLSFSTFPVDATLAVRPGGTPPPSPVERLTITADGRIGIDTTNPLTKFDVRGPACFQGAISVNHSGVTGLPAGPDTGPAIRFGAVDSPAAFYIGSYDKNAPRTTAALSVYSYEFGDCIQSWTSTGNVGIGTSTPSSKLHVFGDLTVTGDVLLAGADCAEEFDAAIADHDLEPGTVVVIDERGLLAESTQAYDTKVAGVVSGAGTLKPAIILDKKLRQSGVRLPIALVGKVFCKVDAQYGSIEVGDLLTTSPTPGHAMKAADSAKAFGAVVGKALRSHAGGAGLLPILVALQ